MVGERDALPPDRAVTTIDPVTAPATELEQVLGLLDVDVARLQHADLDVLTAQEELRLVRRIETIRRRLDHATDRAADHLHESAAFSLDGHRSARSALKHLGRLSGSEAHGRTQTARALRDLPAVASAYEGGQVPVAHVRAIARTVSNPRVAEFLGVADAVFADQASVLPYDDFVAWLRQWEALADADGAAEAADSGHERRHVSLLESAVTREWILTGSHGALQGAAMKEILDRFEQAEFAADWADARRVLGNDTRVEHLARTGRQRRADAVLEIFRRAAATAPGARTPEPLVNIVIGQSDFEDQVRRMSGAEVPDRPIDPGGRPCRTVGGTQLTPAEAVAAALIGHVRRVVIDSAGNVIDLGRRRRLFQGSSREAVEVQALLRGHRGLGCLWPGCDVTHVQIDHREPAARGGATDVANGEPLCGGHNRIKECGFRPVRGPNGEWTVHRRDGPLITPSI